MTTADILVRLVEAFPSATFPPASFQVWLDDLEGIPAPVLDSAVTRIIREEAWFPSLAAIRLACAELALALPTETEALAQADARAMWRVADDKDWDRPVVHPLVERAVALIGGFRELRTSTDPAVVRGQLARYYRELRASAIRESQLSDTITPAYRTEITAA
jgi:hypothetical protein